MPKAVPIGKGSLKKLTKRAERKLLKKQLKNKKRPDYFQYIKSPQWRKRRKQFFIKNGRGCAACPSRYKVGLHHLSYERLGYELDEDLVPLCWPCHQKYHEKYGNRENNKTTHQFIIDSQEVEELRKIVSNF